MDLIAEIEFPIDYLMACIPHINRFGLPEVLQAVWIDDGVMYACNNVCMLVIEDDAFIGHRYSIPLPFIIQIYEALEDGLTCETFKLVEDTANQVCLLLNDCISFAIMPQDLGDMPNFRMVDIPKPAKGGTSFTLNPEYLQDFSDSVGILFGAESAALHVHVPENPLSPCFIDICQNIHGVIAQVTYPKGNPPVSRHYRDMSPTAIMTAKGVH